MLLYNSENGSLIKDLWIYDKFYFDSKKGEEFKIGDVVQIDDRVALYIRSLYAFVDELTVTEAKNILEQKEKKKFPCDVCSFISVSSTGLAVHKKKHEQIVSIPGVRVIKVEGVEVNNENRDVQKEIEDEDKEAGLTGPGLQDDTSRPSVIL